MTGQEGVVRPAEAGDLPLLGPLEVAAGRRFAEVGLASVAGDEPPSLAAYAEAHDRGHLWVGTVPSTDVAGGQELVGYVWVLDLDGQHHLEQISVRAEHGGKGIGVALVEQAVAWARAEGGTSLTLSTFLDVAWNGPWYERIGFAVIDAQEQATDPRWVELRAHEAELGLDLARRAVMRRQLSA